MKLLDFIQDRQDAEHGLQKFNEVLSGNNASLEDVLLSLSGKSEDELLHFLAAQLDCELITFDSAASLITTQAIQNALGCGLDWEYLKQYQWYPLGQDEEGVKIVTSQPLCPEAENYLLSKLDEYQLFLANESVIQRVVTIVNAVMQNVVQQNSSDVERLRALASEAPVVNLVNSLFNRAVDAGASDMHVEPSADGGRVRIRVDGVLRLLDTVPLSLVLPVISRIKILSNMDIAEKRRPQDGKIELHHRNIDIRVSAVPLKKGESMVLRFLVKDSLQFDVAELGFESDINRLISNDLEKTAGVILMTGPTGSGKTTTLYSFLQRLNSSKDKIITLEDPVEYELEGVNQIQVNSDIGFDFAAGLRSVVRQDPDIIMVGEIRDAETARIAMQSSLTGHLVFSTVHTNDAPSAFIRLIDLGVEEFLLNASVISIIAQRLVRRLCPHCAIPTAAPDDAEVLNSVERLASLHGVVPDWRIASGCKHCNQTGYKGRMAVIEYLPNNDQVKAMRKDQHFTLSSRQYMRDQGLRSLFEDGLLKAMQGKTTYDEVIRVVGAQ